MIAYRIQEEAFGGLDCETVKLLDGLARGEKPNELNRCLKTGTVFVREYNGERHTVTVLPNGFLWRDTTYCALQAGVIVADDKTGGLFSTDHGGGKRRFSVRCDEAAFLNAPWSTNVRALESTNCFSASLIMPALWRQSAFMSIRAAEAASLIGNINSISHARCMA